MFFSIKTIVSNNIKILIMNMNNKSFNKIISMNSFCYSFVILMSIIPKSNEFTVIINNTRLSHSRFTRITNNIFNSRFNITSFNLGSMNIETIFRSIVNMFFKRFKLYLTKMFFKKRKQSSLKAESKHSKRKIIKFFPRSEVSSGSFSNKYMNMRIPFKVTTKSMKSRNKAKE